MARILGQNPRQPIRIPDASLVKFGARIRRQSDVAANIMPVPAPFSMFFADVDEQNLVLARGFNLLFRSAARMIPFTDGGNDPRNPGDDFPNIDAAFAKLSIAPPSVYRRGTGVIPGRQANLGDLCFEVFKPLIPLPSPSAPAPDAGGLGLNAPASDSPEAAARLVEPRVISPQLIDDDAIVLGGCEVETGVVVGPGSYITGDVAPAVFVVAPGNEFLIAPSAPQNARYVLPKSASMLAQWRHSQDMGGGCGCGLGSLARMSA